MKVDGLISRSFKSTIWFRYFGVHFNVQLLISRLFTSTDRPVYISLTVYFLDSQPDQFYLGSFNPDRRCSEYEWEYFIIWSYWLFIGRDAYTQLDPRCFLDYDWYMDYPSKIAKFQHKKDWLESLDRSPSGLPCIYSKKPSCIPKTWFSYF